MKITISQYAGFCDGVDRAYKIVEKLAQDKKTRRPIFVLGSLVHNDDVVKKIEALGVKKINRDQLKNSSASRRIKIGTLIITAHGVGPDIYALAKRKKINVIDTTCPKVIKVQRLAKIFNDRLYQIIIIGEKKHKEVRGIHEWAGGQANIIESENDLQKLKLDAQRKIALISQTTQNQDFVKKIASQIKKKYKQLEIVDTLCSTTHNRQDEVKKMAGSNDVMLIIGSSKSSNSTRLWEISQKINKKSHFIEQANQLKAGWFKNCKKIGVTAGASTPSWVIRAVIEKLEVL